MLRAISPEPKLSLVALLPSAGALARLGWSLLKPLPDIPTDATMGVLAFNSSTKSHEVFASTAVQALRSEISTSELSNLSRLEQLTADPGRVEQLESMLSLVQPTTDALVRVLRRLTARPLALAVRKIAGLSAPNLPTESPETLASAAANKLRSYGSTMKLFEP